MKKNRLTLVDYFRIVISLAIFIAIFGLIGPNFISTDNDIAVLAGIMAITIAVPGIWFILSPTIKKIKRSIK